MGIGHTGDHEMPFSCRQAFLTWLLGRYGLIGLYSPSNGTVWIIHRSAKQPKCWQLTPLDLEWGFLGDSQCSSIEQLDQELFNLQVYPDIGIVTGKRLDRCLHRVLGLPDPFCSAEYRSAPSRINWLAANPAESSTAQTK